MAGSFVVTIPKWERVVLTVEVLHYFIKLKDCSKK